MKAYILPFLLLLLSTISFAQTKDVELRAYLDYKQFYAPGVGNYVEFQLQFVGPSINYTGVEGGLVGELAVFMEVTQHDSNIVSDAYRLSSPLMRDSIVEDFYDLKRFVLTPGTYTLSLVLKDLNSAHDALETSQIFTVEDLSQSIAISDIQIAEVATLGDPSSIFYKSGYDILPRLSTFYPQELNFIPAYFEIYNSTLFEDSVFAIKQSIIDATKNSELENYTNYYRQTTAEVVPVFRKVDISALPSGKYFLNFTLVNKNMMELSTQTYEFERSNDQIIDYNNDEIVLDPAFQQSIPDDSLGYFLESLIPISGSNEVKNIIRIAKMKDADRARKYIQVYWTRTAPENPYETWIKYKMQVELVERLYANNFQEGFETDRGRVYLQYGSPTNIITRDNQGPEYPYEIWQYNKIGRFSNKRFIFYNPDLVNNAYRLLHSDMIGELKNPSWQRELVKRDTRNGDVDDPNANVIDRWGSNSSDYYNQY